MSLVNKLLVGNPIKMLNTFRNRVLANSFHSTNVNLKAEDRKEMLASLPKKDEGADGEKSIDMDSMINK